MYVLVFKCAFITGTHVLKSVTAGAALIKDDLFKREVLEDGRISKTNVLDYSRRSFNRWCGSRRRYNSRTTERQVKNVTSVLIFGIRGTSPNHSTDHEIFLNVPLCLSMSFSLSQYTYHSYNFNLT